MRKMLVIVLTALNLGVSFVFAQQQDILKYTVRLESALAVQTGLSSGYASGVLVGDGTYVLTVAHTIRQSVGEGGIVAVVTNTGERYKPTLIGIDDRHDVALLKINPSKKLPAISLASEKPEFGEKIYIYGCDSDPNPHLCKPAPRSMIGVQPGIGILGSGAPANAFTGGSIPGQSGGPIVNERGELIGLVHGGTGPFGTAVGYTFIRNMLAKIPTEPRVEIYIRIYCGTTEREIEQCREIGSGLIKAKKADGKVVKGFIIVPIVAGKKNGDFEIFNKPLIPPPTLPTPIVSPPIAPLKTTVINLNDFKSDSAYNSNYRNYQLATTDPNPHERVHGVNAIGRNILGGGVGTALQVSFSKEGNPIVIYMSEPKGTIEEVNAYIPNFIKFPGSGWENYVSKNIQYSYWKEITYLFDEQSAYIMGSNAYIETENISRFLSVERTSEFAVITMSAASFIKDNDPDYFKNSNFKSLLKLQIERSMDVIGRGLQMKVNDEFDQNHIDLIRAIMNRLQKDPEAKKIRQFMINTYGKKWTQKFLGFEKP